MGIKLVTMEKDNLIIVIKCKGTDNIIGLKEDIAMRLEDVVGIERIDVREEGEDWLKSNG